MELDMTDPLSVGRLQDEVTRKFGRLDILVNRAYVEIDGDLETQTPEDWLASVGGDMQGLFSLCRAFVPIMVRQGKSIINISSIYGVVANDPSLYEGTEMKQPPSYNFVKAGMINFTRYVASYYGKRGGEGQLHFARGVFLQRAGTLCAKLLPKGALGEDVT